MSTRRIGVACLLTSAALFLQAAGADLPGLQAAQELALRLIEETRDLMQAEVRDKGPVAALEMCSKIALGLARQYEKEGWRIRRVSVSYRNPADAPDEYEARVVESFAALKARGELHIDTEHAEVVTEEGQRYLRYLKPIIMGSPVCLSCHGGPQDIPPDVAAPLQRLYPEDRATGYRVGDLRGAVSVKMPLRAGK